MVRKHLTHRALSVGACGAALFFCAAPAAAKGKRACMPAYDSYKSALDREQSGHLREARMLLQSCATAAQSACSALAQKCAAKYTQLGSEMPTVVPLVTDDSGAPEVDVQVKVDGDLLASHLDGKAQPVDIGLHEFSFSNEGGVLATQRVLVMEGQRNRVVSVVLRSTAPPVAQKPAISAAEMQTGSADANARPPRAMSDEIGSDRHEAGETASNDKTAAPDASAPEGALKAIPASPPPKHRSPLPSYLLGTAGLVGVGAGALLTFWGRNDNDLLGQCKPNCKQSSVDHVRALYIASDVSFGVGAVALGAATWLFVRSRSTDSAPAPAAAYQFDVQPAPSGAVASVKGTF